MKLSSVIFWFLIGIAIISFGIASLLVIDPEFGENYAPEYLKASKAENRLAVADFFVGLGGFSAAAVALIKTYETIRDAQKAPIIKTEIAPHHGTLSRNRIGSPRLKLSLHSIQQDGQKKYNAQLDLRLMNTGNLSAPNLVFLVRPSKSLTKSAKTSPMENGIHFQRDQMGLMVYLESSPDGYWQVVRFGEEASLRFHGGKELQLIPGDCLDIGRIEFGLGISSTTAKLSIPTFSMELVAIASNASPSITQIDIYADPAEQVFSRV
jgi:hypothetical protein